MGGLCTRSDKEQELKLVEPTIEKTGKPHIDLEAEFLMMIKNIEFTNAYVKVNLYLIYSNDWNLWNHLSMRSLLNCLL